MEINIEYTLSNNDIKFPTLFEDDLDSIFRKEKMTKEILVFDLSQLIDNFSILVEKLNYIIQNNVNDFQTLCLEYKTNIYDLIVMLKLNQELAIVVLSKFKQIHTQINLSKYEDFFPSEKNKNNEEIHHLIDIYHKDIDKDFAIIKKKFL